MWGIFKSRWLFERLRKEWNMNLLLREKVIISFARNVLSKLLIRFLIFFELYSNFTGVNCVEIEEYFYNKILREIIYDG